MSNDLNRLADAYLHELLDPQERTRFEQLLESDPSYSTALEAALRRHQTLRDAKPPEPQSSPVVNRVLNQMLVNAATDERKSRRRKKVVRWLAGGVSFSVLLLISLHVHYANLAANQIDLEVRGQDQLVAGSEASLRVRLTDHGEPLAGVPIEISLEQPNGGEPVSLAQFTTDANGTASPRFTLPDWADGEYRLSVVAQTPGRPERIEQPIKLRRSARVILATDKPVYQPGQIIRMRAIALRTHDSRPLAGLPAVFTVSDPKGNVIFKRTGPASKFGIFAGDCEIADEVNEGAYRIVARIGDTESALNVDVRPYVLPKFKIEVAFDKPFFKTDEPIRGRIRAVYFHGQPVRGQATISLDGGNSQAKTFPVELGEARFLLDPVRVPENEPAHLARLTVHVTDTADQKHERSFPVSVARQDLVISAVPQTGSLTTGLATRLLFRVQTPDGQPVAAVLTSPEFARPLATDATGWASMTYTPGSADFRATVSARADGGQTAWREIHMAVNRPAEGRVLTTDKLDYVGGETMTVIALGRNGLLFVDFLRDGQTVRTESLAIQQGRGELAFDLPAEWAGEVDIRSYTPDSVRSIQTRKVTVAPAQQVKLIGGVRPSVPLILPGYLGSALAALPHRPGEKARLSLALRDKAGNPVVGAISLAAVDEAVFSVYAPKPRQPLTPAAPPSLDEPVSEITGDDDRTTEAEPFSLSRTTYPEKVQAVESEQATGHLRTLLGWAVLVLAGIGYFFYRVWEEAPKAVSLAAMILALPALGSTTLVAGCDNKKMAFDARSEAPHLAPLERASAVNKEPAESPAFRIRRYFPETLLWKPEVISDDEGRVEFDFDFADSITSWRFTASAITADGRLGSWRQDVPVFQPFFVDANFPTSLTRNDSVTLSIVVSNYLKGPQIVRVELPDADWYQRIGDAVQELKLAEGEVKAIEFRVKVTRAGRHALTVTARAASFADAVRRDVTVNADGKSVEVVANGSLDRPASVPIDLPKDAIEGGTRATLKLYPSGFSQLVEGMSGIFQAPHGCFEQTSSTTYPNVLALDYLQRNHKSDRDIEERARRFVHLGYQRLLTFEVKGGGFDWYGRGPANRALTAYGLMEFRDMAKVAEVDPKLIPRTRDWLLKQRNGDGSWQPDWDPSHRANGSSATLRSTAYIAWAAFQDAERGDAAPTIKYLLRTSPEAIGDAYVLALVCNALQAMGHDSADYLRRLEQLKHESADRRQVWWEIERGSRSQFYGAGRSGDVETTALAVLALSQAHSRPDLSRKALAWMVGQRASNGTWGSTQATVLALKALLANTVPPAEERRFEVAVNGERVKAWTVPADQSEVMQQLDLTLFLRAGRQAVDIRELTGAGTPFQLNVRHHVPRAERAKEAEAFGLVLAFDRDVVPVGDLIRVTASVWNRGRETAPMTMLELPIPPGFELAEDLTKLVADRSVDRVEMKPGKAVLYLRALEGEKVREVSYRLRALTPVKITVPAATVYEYYDPERRAISETRVIEAVTK